MILVDYSNVASASIFKALAKNDPAISNAAGYLLGKIRNYNVNFRDKYGELILCADSISWRVKYWSNYKARRRALRAKEMESNDLDPRHELYKKIHEFWDILDKHSPYKCLKIRGAEGDDIVATLARTPGNHVVISADKDIAQLTRYENVSCFHPITKTFVDNGKNFWHRLVITGDGGDDVPNILSDPDTFMKPGMRQRSVRAPFLNALLESDDPEATILSMKYNGITPEEVLANYRRNKKLIDLSCIPSGLRQIILDAANVEKPKYDMINMIMELKCPSYIDKLDDFAPAKAEAAKILDIH